MYEYNYMLKREGKKWKMQMPEEEIFVLLDEDKFLRAMGNLLDNAGKYSKEGDEICLTLKKREQSAEILLSNPMDEKLKEEMPDPEVFFERFYRADPARITESKEGGESGTGLGLPIAKRILELHGGTLHAAYEGDQILFHMELPVCESLS